MDVGRCSDKARDKVESSVHSLRLHCVCTARSERSRRSRHPSRYTTNKQHMRCAVLFDGIVVVSDACCVLGRESRDERDQTRETTSTRCSRGGVAALKLLLLTHSLLLLLLVVVLICLVLFDLFELLAAPKVTPSCGACGIATTARFLALVEDSAHAFLQLLVRWAPALFLLVVLRAHTRSHVELGSRC